MSATQAPRVATSGLGPGAHVASTRPRRVRPYPLDALPRMLRVQVELGRVLWGHLGALLGAARVMTPAGRQALDRALGGRLQIAPQEPYLGSGDRLLGALRSAQVLELVRIAPGGTRYLLAVDASFCRAVGLSGDDQLTDLVAQAMRGTALQISALPAAPLAALLGEPSLREPLVLEATLRIGEVVGWARLITSSALRVSATPAAAEAPLRWLWDQRSRLTGVVSALTIEAGYGFLRSPEVLALSAGDIVLLDHFGPRPITGGPVWLRLGGGVFPAHLDGAGVTVLGSYYLRAQAMADQQSEEATSTAAADPAAPNESLLRELKVQITCEIGRVTLSAREVLELRPGAVLPVGRPLAGPVDLTAGGRLLAHGELVDVEGEIGVRITEIVE